MNTSSEQKNERTLLADITIIGLFSMLIIAADIYWQSIYHFPPYADYAFHLTEADSVHNALNSTGFFSGLVTAWIWPGDYPAGLYYIAHIYMQFTDSSLEHIMMSQILLIPVLVASLYYMTRPRFGILSGTASILAGSVIPQLFLNTDHFLLDHAQTVFVCAAMCLLINNIGFNNNKLAFLLGISAGLGCLCKFTAFTFILFPFLIAAYAALKKEKSNKIVIAAHFACFFSAFLIPYYAANCKAAESQRIFWGGMIFDEKALLLAGLIAICWCAWIALITLLRKHSVIAANTFSAAATAYIIGFPWFICNANIVSNRSKPLLNQFLNHANMQMIKHCLEEYYAVFPNIVYFLLFCAALVIIFTSNKYREERLMASTFLALPLTAITLGYAIRYAEPCFVMSAAITISILSRKRFGSITATVLALLLFISNIYMPFVNGVKAAFGIDISEQGQFWELSYYFHRTEYNFSLPPNDFNIAMNYAADFLKPDRPSLVLICAEEPFQPFPADFYAGLQFWSQCHKGRIVPFFFDPDKRNMIILFKENLATLALMLNDKFPELLNLYGELTFADNFDGKIPPERIDYIIIPENTANRQAIQCPEAIIREKLGANAFLTEKDYGCIKLHIWSRP
ncbi:MAG: glycosyltransferase family 39 protein [bacterium]|nr:glycosyltransferase family 39 protein [bacterium]